MQKKWSKGSYEKSQTDQICLGKVMEKANA